MTEADRMLILLGENGERWIKGMVEHDGCMCVTGAFIHDTSLGDETRLDKFALFKTSISKVSGREIKDWTGVTRWNDDPATTWADIKAALQIYHQAELDLAAAKP